MLGALGMSASAGALGLGSLIHPAIAEEMKRREKQVIFIWLDGGMSQLESWDPKPNTEFGGPFRTISTSAPGIQVSELLPLTANQMHHLAIVRVRRCMNQSHQFPGTQMASNRFDVDGRWIGFQRDIWKFGPYQS